LKKSKFTNYPNRAATSKAKLYLIHAKLMEMWVHKHTEKHFYNNLDNDPNLYPMYEILI